MDATFIIDHEYDSFEAVWDELVKLQSLANPQKLPTVESIRFSLKPESGKKWLAIEENPYQQVGWQFSGEPSDSFLNQLQLQAKELAERKINYRITCEPFSKASAIELRYNSPQPPFIAIPFEDKVENARRFFGRFAPAFAKALRVSEAKVQETLAAFYEHCSQHWKDQKPFKASFSGGLALLGKKPIDLWWIPRHGTVGRHEIFTELHIIHPDNDVATLARLLGELGKKDQNSPTHLFMQFFAGAQTQPAIQIEPQHLYEMTFQYNNLPFESARTLVNQLKAPEIGMAVTDSFSLFEQWADSMGPKCYVTYTLRKTLARGYELRVNTIWDEETVDPEVAVAPIEKAIGHPWARII